MAKQKKTSVDYSPGMGEKRCGRCVHYITGGLCKLVEGYISSGYWCRLFKPKAHRANR